MRKHRRTVGLRRHHADRHHRLLVDQRRRETRRSSWPAPALPRPARNARRCRRVRRRRTADRRSDRAACRVMKRDGMKAFGSRQSFSCRCNSHGAIRMTSFFLTGRPAIVSGPRGRARDQERRRIKPHGLVDHRAGEFQPLDIERAVRRSPPAPRSPLLPGSAGSSARR